MLIQVTDLAKRYRMGDNIVNALEGVSLAIDNGEFVAIMGPSGSGKSTFMNLIGCLDTPTEGSYQIAGDEVAHMSAEQLAATRNIRIGFVFQQFNLLARNTALENVTLPLMYSSVPESEREAKAQRQDGAKEAELGGHGHPDTSYPASSIAAANSVEVIRRSAATVTAPDARSMSTRFTPTSLVTSSVTAATQWPQVMPETVKELAER